MYRGKLPEEYGKGKRKGHDPSGQDRILEGTVCPLCGKGHIIKGRTGYGCSEYRNGCQTVFPFTDYPADLTPARLNSRLKKLRK